MASVEFNDIENEALINKYRKDAKILLQLRVDVKRRYNDDLDYKEYEKQIQKLIDKHVTTDGQILKITELVKIINGQSITHIHK